MFSSQSYSIAGGLRCVRTLTPTEVPMNTLKKGQKPGIEEVDSGTLH